MYRRICILGTSASGKSTLARELSERLGLEHIELDALYHGPNWMPATDEVFPERLREKTRGDKWIVDGNYVERGNHEALERAELIIWLDYKFRVVLWRVLKRTFLRWIRKEELWNGNRESLRTTLLTKDSIIWWVITTHRRRRRTIPQILSIHGSVPHLVFRSPRETTRWLENVPGNRR